MPTKQVFFEPSSTQSRRWARYLSSVVSKIFFCLHFRASSTIVISSDNNKNPNVLTKAPRKNYKNASLKDSKEKLDAISFVFVYLRFCFFFNHTSEEHLAQLQSPFNLKLKYKPRDPTVFFLSLSLTMQMWKTRTLRNTLLWWFVLLKWVNWQFGSR